MKFEQRIISIMWKVTYINEIAEACMLELELLAISSKSNSVVSESTRIPSLKIWFRTVQWSKRTVMRTDGRADVMGSQCFFVHRYVKVQNSMKVWHVCQTLKMRLAPPQRLPYDDVFLSLSTSRWHPMSTCFNKRSYMSGLMDFVFFNGAERHFKHPPPHRFLCHQAKKSNIMWMVMRAGRRIRDWALRVQMGWLKKLSEVNGWEQRVGYERWAGPCL